MCPTHLNVPVALDFVAKIVPRAVTRPSTEMNATRVKFILQMLYFVVRNCKKKSNLLNQT